jgi:hypothetical protein
MKDQIKNTIKKRRGSGYRIRVLVLLATIPFLLSCGKSLPSIDGLDMLRWKDDKNGCGGFREAAKQIVINQKDKLLSLSETDIVRLLGKPDETELYKRNEKFYKYFFSNGPGCSKSGERKSITLRFNAVGLSKEAVVD